MTHSSIDGRKAAPAFLALAVVGFVATAPSAYAADPVPAAASDADSSDRDQIVVTGEQGDGEVADPRATAPLLDTPQTVTVISDQVIRKQNLQTLRDALQTIPGITFGAGEGGGGYGDSINLRGYSANNDITIDGVRDGAQYTRTDPFNLQQIEVFNGANSVFNGSGSVGGTINLVTKSPQPDDLTIVQGAIGTDDYYRGAIDGNWRLNELVAVRLNGAYHENGVAGRDVEKFRRWGIAPSVTIGVGSPTSLTLSYSHQEDENTPIYGVPYFRSLVNAGPLPGVDPSDYFGYRNLDRQDTTVDRATAIFRHKFSDAVSVRNLSRWQRVAQYSQTSAPQGTFCLANGLQPVGASGSSTVGIACPAGLATGFYAPSGPRGTVRDQENQLLHNQTDLRVVTGKQGGIRNTLVVGMSATVEDYSIASGSLLRNADGSAVTAFPAISLANPNTVYAGPNNLVITSRSKAETTNFALYAFDTIELGSMFEINGGVRWESNRADFRNIPLLSPPPGTAALTDLQRRPQVSDETLFSYRVGAVFKPTPATSIYAAYGNSKTPSSATVRLGCGVLSAVGAADPCAVAPESAKNYEIGAKADLFGRRLQLTAAVFRNERTNFRVPSNDPAQPGALQVLDGRARVDGVTLGASGNVTPEWTLFANYTYLNGKVKQSVSDFCLANPSAACGNSAAIRDVQFDQDLLQTPEHSGSLFTTYKLPFGLEIGYGLSYQGSFALNNRVLVAGAVTPQFRSDDYLIHRAFLGYTFGNGLTAQLNIQNFTDEQYYTGIRNNVSATTGAISGGWATPGDRRSAVLSLFYSF
ncbi:TonB-dependent receptor [Sphingomonas sp. MG17]|uniref:TonB-dependent receptor n=1 Tax=Sphingomonas tagetis TaxID=2949092 RepID=A0A9X2KKI2_9SPHN|nr:TonB-dependent receptor [Sphingomonas tagetis]MCP3730539.1 TonB-dependent receptor [Sphingomonas tagetis]